MIYAQKLTLFLAIAYSMMACRVTAPENWNDAMALMVKYNEKGRHDDAIEVAQDWMKKHPADASHGFVFYDQIAVTYLIKAFKDSAHKDQWIRQAVDYYEKDLAAHEKGRVDVELYTVGRGYEYAGDLSTYDSCLYWGERSKTSRTRSFSSRVIATRLTVTPRH